MPKKFKSCVKKVEKEEMKRYGYEKYNPYAVCRKSTGYSGSTRHKSKFKGRLKMKHRVRGHMRRVGHHHVRVRGHTRRSHHRR